MGFFKNVFSDSKKEKSESKESSKPKTLSKSRPASQLPKPSIPPVQIPNEPIELPSTPILTHRSPPPRPRVATIISTSQANKSQMPYALPTTSTLDPALRPNPVQEDSSSSSSTLDSILTTSSASSQTTISTPSTSAPNLPLSPDGVQKSYIPYTRPPPPRPPKLRSSPLAPLPDTAPNYHKIPLTPRSTPPPQQQLHQLQPSYPRRNSLPAAPHRQFSPTAPNSHPLELPTPYNSTPPPRSASTSSLTSLSSTSSAIPKDRNTPKPRRKADLQLALLPQTSANGEFSHLSILSGDPLGGSFHRYPTALSAPSSPTAPSATSKIRPLSSVPVNAAPHPRPMTSSRKRSSTMHAKKWRGGFEPTILEEGSTGVVPVRAGLAGWSSSDSSLVEQQQQQRRRRRMTVGGASGSAGWGQQGMGGAERRRVAVN